MYYHCGVPLQAVSEYTIGDYSLKAKPIIVPSPGVLTDKCWDALLAASRRGATVAISGIIDADDHGLPVERSRLFNADANIESVSQSEDVSIGGKLHYAFRRREDPTYRKIRFPGNRILFQPYGLGRFILESAAAGTRRFDACARCVLQARLNAVAHFTCF